MENLKFKVVESESEVKSFVDKVEIHTGVRLPMQYANQSTIKGAYLDDKLVAGYMVVTKPDFRSLMFVPDEVKNSHEFFKNDQYEMMEINGLWLGPAIKTPKMQFAVWIRLILDVFKSKKQFLLLMSNARNKNIKKLHNMSKPNFIYTGPAQMMAGNTSHSEIRVGYTTRWNALLNIPKYWLEIKQREKRVRQRLVRIETQGETA